MEPIIFIDDNTEDLQLIKEMAAEMGVANPVVVFDPLAALAFFGASAEKVLGIISGVHMQALDGFALRARLLATCPALAHVPFLFLSATQPDMVENRQDPGVSAWFEKTHSLSGMKESLTSIFSLLKVAYI